MADDMAHNPARSPAQSPAPNLAPNLAQNPGQNPGQTPGQTPGKAPVQDLGEIGAAIPGPTPPSRPPAPAMERGGIGPLGDKRREPRPRAYLGGKLVYGDYFSLDCIVRDINGGGARVQIAAGQAVPDRLYLLELKSGVAYDAEVAWRRYPLIGLRFERAHNLAEAETPHLRILKRLWTSTREQGSLL